MTNPTAASATALPPDCAQAGELEWQRNVDELPEQFIARVFKEAGDCGHSNVVFEVADFATWELVYAYKQFLQRGYFSWRPGSNFTRKEERRELSASAN